MKRPKVSEECSVPFRQAKLNATSIGQPITIAAGERQ